MPTTPSSATPEETLTIRPQPRARMEGTAAWIAAKAPSMLSWRVPCHSASGMSSKADRVVDEDIELPEARQGGRDSRLDRLRRSEVELQRQRLAALPLDLPDDLRGLLVAPVGERHAGPLGRELQSHLPPASRRSPARPSSPVPASCDTSLSSGR
ncbi:hypothetical protein BE20_23485 [Sorangium cellulosum]|nr:hypothetical protein BE20_23485 [Sorangium cellulosum]